MGWEKLENQTKDVYKKRHILLTPENLSPWKLKTQAPKKNYSKTQPYI
jgi:hypothetical protein